MTSAFRMLVRHFIGASLAPEVLTEVGQDYLRRTLIGLLALLLMLGWVLPRVFFHKYAVIGALAGSGVYLRAVQADSLFMIAVPMVLSGLVSVMAGPFLFPDEIDYRVLTPLPISRAVLFGAKLVAVLAIVAMAILAVNLVTSFWFPLAVSTRKAQHSLVARVLAHGLGATAGSVFMFVAVMAWQGLTIVAVPAQWQRRTSVVIQATLCVVFLLSFQLIARMPGMDVTAATIDQSPLRWMPPAWFFGIERWWLDGRAAGGYVIAAERAAWFMAISAGLVMACYLRLYQSAEQLAGVTGAGRGDIARPGMLSRWMGTRVRPQTLAIVDFIRTGLSRSRLHQFVFLLAVGAGVALLIGQLAPAMEGAGPPASPPRAAVQAALSAPLLVALTFVLGLRAAFRWPLDRGAAWIFRLVEDPASRAAMLDGAAYSLIFGAWTISMLTAVLVQPRVVGVSTWIAGWLTTLAVLALCEWLLNDWRRIPYACTYLPGSKLLAYHLGALCAYYFIVVIIGGNLIRWAVLTPPRSLVVGGALLASWAVLRRERRKTWGLLPLEFEDDDPAEAQTLKLG